MSAYSFAQVFDSAGFQFCTVIVCISCLYYSLVHSRPERIHNKIFLLMLVDHLIAGLCNLISAFVKPLVPVSDVYFYIRAISQYLYFVFHPLLAPLFCFYVSIVTGANRRLKRSRRFLYESPMYIMLVMVLINPLTGWIYYFGENREYARNWGVYVLYSFSGLYFIFSVIVLLFFWKSVSSVIRHVMIFFFSIVAVGTTVQLVIMPVHTELFSQAIALVAIMITVENETSRKDSRTGILNHAACEEDLQKMIGVGAGFSLLCLKMHNPLNLMQLIGPSNIEKLTEMTCEFLNGLVPKSEIYYVGPGTFVIIFEDGSEDEIVGIARKIRERFQSGWDFQGRVNHFDSSVLLARFPEDLHSMQEVMTLIHAPLPKNLPIEDDDTFNGALSQIFKQNRLEKSILNGLRSRNFEVYYQPIYTAKNLSICSGEALLRLHDEEIGELYPGDFLPIAERGGLIFELGDFVLEEVCKFLNSGIPQEMGIETLSVNLSVVQCIQLHYAERIIGIISRYNVDPSRITFEIMESAAATDFKALKEFVDTLLRFGCHFTVNDYGIGYSNIHSIFHLNIDCVKIDKTILREAANSDTGQIILDSSITMIKKMKKKIIISGIENQVQIEMAEKAGIDYLQGFYFSNPVSQNEFINVLRATRLAKIEEQKAIASNEAMSSFLANMSHEIRTPINAVLGMDEMILRESKDSRILEYAKTIEGAGRTLLSLINDILDFSKIESGKMEIVNKPYSLSTVLSDLFGMMKLKAKEKGLMLASDIDPAIPDRLIGDELRIKQILLNLMNNAIKYTEKGTVQLNVGYRMVSTDKLHLIMTVKDTGIGIRQEDLDTLFDKFKRLDTDKNKTVEGTGLGLTITRQILSLMDGKIDVKSTYGKGSTFIISLPQQIEPAQHSNAGSDQSKAAEDEKKMQLSVPEASILIVDDNPVNLTVVRSLLEYTGAKIDTADSGKECLSLVEKNPYDIIFLDYRMPEMDGIETLQKMKELPYNKSANASVIALTANAVSGARERFLQEGFEDYITKPVSGKKLVRLLKMYLPPEKIGVQVVEEEETATENPDLEVTNQGNTGMIETVDPSKALSEVGIDRAAGIRNCETEEIFETVLKTFLEDLPEKKQQLSEVLDAADYQNFGIIVHALKSASRIVGAEELSKLCEQLEVAADEEDASFISDNQKILIAKIEAMEGYAAGSKKNEPAAIYDDLLPLSEAKWEDALNTIRELAANMDGESIGYVLKDLSGYRLSEDQEEKLDTLKKLNKDLEFAALQKFYRR